MGLNVYCQDIENFNLQKVINEIVRENEKRLSILKRFYMLAFYGCVF